jgi:type I restriction enzyme M protein
MTANSQQQQAELHKKLWDMANSLRGQMEASEFKNYILGVIFYRFLSEKVEEEAAALLENDSEQTYQSFWESEAGSHDDIVDSFVGNLGYIIKPEHLFSKFVADIKTGNFSITTLQEAINEINASTVGSETQESFDHLFDDLDLNSSKLGKTVADRTALIGKILQHVADIPFKFDDSELDLLGSSYEFLIGRFAQTAGKSAGEFYTPQQVSRILAKIVAGDKKQLKSVYDPTCGSGSLLLRIARETKVLNYYGQELTSTTYNLARMNMMLHGVSHEDFDIKNDNTLTRPQHLGKKFEAIVANPPYSAHWNPSVEMADDVRFSEYGKLAPKTKADFAFVQHMMYHLDDNGTMAVVLPHGVLFRGAAEGVIRKQLIEKNYLDAVIGLPANIFYGTSIPTCILVFKKCREADEKVLIIDASSEFENGKNSNTLTDENVETIVGAYESRNEIDKFSREVSLKELKENDYNLNIPRYIDSSSEEDQINLEATALSIAQVDADITEVDSRIDSILKSLRTVEDSNE